MTIKNYSALGVVIALSLTGCVTTEYSGKNQTQTELKKAVSTSFLINKSPPQPIETTLTAKTTIRDRIDLDKWECDVSARQCCNASRSFVADPGWQACSFLYTEYSKGGYSTTFNKNPTNWYTSDSEDPDRFRAYDVKIGACGATLDGTGAWIKLHRVGIRMIPASATNQERYAAGCDMPAH